MLIRRASLSDAMGIARVHVDTWRSTYHSIVPADYLASLEYEPAAQRWRGYLETGNGHVFLAEDPAAGVVGIASAGPGEDGDKEYDAVLNVIYILPGFQGRGLGRALMAAAVEALRGDGHSALLIWVYRDNRARGFYERYGGKAVRTREHNVGGACLEVVGYGYPSLDALAEELGTAPLQ